MSQEWPIAEAETQKKGKKMGHIMLFVCQDICAPLRHADQHYLNRHKGKPRQAFIGGYVM